VQQVLTDLDRHDALPEKPLILDHFVHQIAFKTLTPALGDPIESAEGAKKEPLMRNSLRLGTLFGIPVNLHWTFLLLLGFVAFSQAFAYGSVSAALGGVVFVSAIFGCVVLHEFGHALAARRYGIATRDVTLLPIGGVARLERMPDDPRQELVVALAGPAVNVAIAGVLGIWLFLTGFGAASGLSLTGGSFAARLLSVNLALVVFNMLPAFPMDGGRVLRALLARRLSYVRATDLAATIGRGMAVLFGIAGLMWNPMLILIALFVWTGAGQEAEMVRRREAFSGWRSWFDRQGFEHDKFGSDSRVDPEQTRHRGGFQRVGPWIIYRDDS
jgi:Zn-dependent protease